MEVTTGMGVPTFAPNDRDSWNGDGGSRALEVSTGNPHFVIVVDNARFRVWHSIVDEIGAEICVHPIFPIRPTWSSCAL